MAKCFLHCLSNYHDPIPVFNLQEIVVGRSADTRITDVNCSRRQLSIKADYEKKIVYVKQLGINQSGVNGFALSKDEVVPISDGTIIELLLNHHPHQIKFEHREETTLKVTSVTGSTSIETCQDDGNEKAFSKETPVKSLEKNKNNKLDKGDRKSLKRMRDEVEVEESCSKEPRKTDKPKPCDEDMFEKIDNGLLYIITKKGVQSSSRIAAYDIDGTLIKTKSNLVFPKNIDDWQLAFPEVPAKLKSLSASGHKIVFFTNQAGIGNGKLKIEDFRKKMDNVTRRIGVPCQIFISSGKGVYRKPMMGMYDALVNMKNDDIEIDKAGSLYCGDAAGRKKDHSLADRLFAENIGLPFHTPEHHFCGAPEGAFNGPAFDPKSLSTATKMPSLVQDKQEIVVLVGLPGSGKSWLSNKMEKESKGRYQTVCRDNLGAWQKCVSEATKLIKNGKSVIADSTNPDKESRGRWLTLAKSNGLACRCVVMDVPLAHAQHNNRFRQLTDTKHVVVADIIFHTYRKKYEEPEVKEGYADIVKYKFVPNFDNSLHEDLYYKHLLEK